MREKKNDPIQQEDRDVEILEPWLEQIAEKKKIKGKKMSKTRKSRKVRRITP